MPSGSDVATSLRRCDIPTSSRTRSASAMSALATLRKLGSRRIAEIIDARSVMYRPDATASSTVTFSGMFGVWNVRATPSRATRCDENF